jgi:sugar/nucleoside kinase (ribokinase family)
MDRGGAADGSSDVVVCLGDLLDDVVVLPDGPLRRGADTFGRIERSAGGSAANAARALATLGGRVRLVARVGDDPAGAQLTDALAACGVEACVQRAGRTGCVVVIVDPDGERTMLTDRAASADLDALPTGWDTGLGWLHVSLYACVGEPMASVAVGAAQAAGVRGRPVSVDLASVTVLDALGSGRVRALLARLAPTVVFANADEDATAGRLDWPTVVKRGPDPVLVRAPGGAVVAEVAVAPVTGVLDTTGAGDAFAAGFVLARLRGAPTVEAAAAGNRAAAATLRTVGASTARIVGP